MRKVLRGVCCPERFDILQQIFDKAWTEVGQKANGSASEAEAIRSKLASLVIDLIDAPVLEPDLARKEILEKLDGKEPRIF